ncbi:IclR family transcriptional regulator [Ignatzschineria ureiclastica]|uniref:IclR family transcriptional regulator n=1 Tax=Ignatzschineria ureiclastica TaxID=472582 RepID=A0A2U2AHF9_9GAMM|nr:IclR family transcriptional regulator [Ignatzschineria ureiclastica]PWD82029.1 IclR family transcriptional regulator [Ignatzschineria ureiclastica]GGZ92151.1 IclR family transcriptional regulator [Ignatzschineria ureiclastica]
MNEVEQSDKYLVPGLIRGLKILESFTIEQNEMSLGDIAKILEINRSSAFRLVQTLEHCGYLLKTAHKTYKLNVKVLQLGYSAIESMNIPQQVTTIMQNLRDQTKAAVHLSMLDHTEIVYLNNIQALGAFTSNIRVGTRWPAYATVIGQLLLAPLSNEEIQQRFKSLKAWTRYSDSTATSIAELLPKIEVARQAPYLISWKNFKPDMIACAAPIKNRVTHQTQYVLSISCPATSYADRDTFIAEVVPALLKATEEISQLMSAI